MLRKFKEIANAWIIAANPTPEEKQLAEERISVCNECEHKQENKDIINFYYCGICKCPLSKKIFSLKNSETNPCPANKWKE
jgi:hypothetical protein